MPECVFLIVYFKIKLFLKFGCQKWEVRIWRACAKRVSRSSLIICTLKHKIITFGDNHDGKVELGEDDQVSRNNKVKRKKPNLPTSLAGDLVVVVVVLHGAVLGLPVVVVAVDRVQLDPASLGGGRPGLQLEDDHHDHEADDRDARHARHAGQEDRALQVLGVLGLETG